LVTHYTRTARCGFAAVCARSGLVCLPGSVPTAPRFVTTHIRLLVWFTHTLGWFSSQKDLVYIHFRFTHPSHRFHYTLPHTFTWFSLATFWFGLRFTQFTHSSTHVGWFTLRTRPHHHCSFCHHTPPPTFCPLVHRFGLRFTRVYHTDYTRTHTLVPTPPRLVPLHPVVTHTLRLVWFTHALVPRTPHVYTLPATGLHTRTTRVVHTTHTHGFTHAPLLHTAHGSHAHALPARHALHGHTTRTPTRTHTRFPHCHTATPPGSAHTSLFPHTHHFYGFWVTHWFGCRTLVGLGLVTLVGLVGFG